MTGTEGDDHSVVAAKPASLTHLMGVRGLVQASVLLVLLIAVFWQPIRYTMVHRWIHDASWSFGWLVPVFSVYFLSCNTYRLAATKIRPSYVGLVVLLVSLVCYMATLWIYRFAYPRALTVIGAIAGLTLLLAGWQVLRIAWFPIAFLTFSVPLPQTVYVKITTPLQILASNVAAAVLSALPDVHAEASGIVIDYSHGSVLGHLNVEEACSGMRSMMAIVTLGVAMAYLGVRPFWQRMVLVVMCVPIAMFCNVMRVTITGVIHVYEHTSLGRALGFKWLTGDTPHALLGLATFLVALGLFTLLGWVLSNLYVTDPDGEAGSEHVPGH